MGKCLKIGTNSRISADVCVCVCISFIRTLGTHNKQIRKLPHVTHTLCIEDPSRQQRPETDLYK